MHACAQAEANEAGGAGAALALAHVPAEAVPAPAQLAADVNYPPARASHEEVLADAELFNATLREVLQALGSGLDKVRGLQLCSCEHGVPTVFAPRASPQLCSGRPGALASRQLACATRCGRCRAWRGVSWTCSSSTATSPR